MLRKLLHPARKIVQLIIFASTLSYYSCQKDDIGANREKERDDRVESPVVKDISVINELVIPQNVKTQKFRIKSDNQWQIRLPKDINWVSVTPLFGNEGESVLTVSVLRNDSPYERSASFDLVQNGSNYYSYEKYTIVQCADGTDENGFFNIKIASAGLLESELDRYDLPFCVDSITRLRIEGPLANNDCIFIQEKLKKLIALDLDKAIISKFPQHFFCYTPVLDLTLPEQLPSIENLFYKFPDGGGTILGSQVQAVRISKNSPITTIPPSEFKYCHDLKYITLPDGLKTISWAGFQYCSGLKQISLPEGLTSIGSYAFWCAGFKEINLPQSLQTIDSDAFSHSALAKVTFNSGSKLTKIGSYAFNGCYYLKEFYFPPGLREIGYAAFQQTKLKNITLPNSVNYLGGGVFWESALESINIPAGCQMEAPFGKCSNLREVTIEGDLHSNSEPYINDSPQRIVFLKAVTNINLTLLKVCSATTEIIFHNPIPPAVMFSDLYSPFEIFPYVSRSKCTLRVPEGASAAYKADRIWGAFENIIEQ